MNTSAILQKIDFDYKIANKEFEKLVNKKQKSQRDIDRMTYFLARMETLLDIEKEIRKYQNAKQCK